MAKVELRTPCPSRQAARSASPRSASWPPQPPPPRQCAGWLRVPSDSALWPRRAVWTAQVMPFCRSGSHGYKLCLSKQRLDSSTLVLIQHCFPGPPLLASGPILQQVLDLVQRSKRRSPSPRRETRWASMCETAALAGRRGRLAGRRSGTDGYPSPLTAPSTPDTVLSLETYRPVAWGGIGRRMERRVERDPSPRRLWPCESFDAY